MELELLPYLQGPARWPKILGYSSETMHDPLLVKPKCLLELDGHSFWLFSCLFIIFQVMVYNFQNKCTNLERILDFPTWGGVKFWFGTPCTAFQIYFDLKKEITVHVCKLHLFQWLKHKNNWIQNQCLGNAFTRVHTKYLITQKKNAIQNLFRTLFYHTQTKNNIYNIMNSIVWEVLKHWFLHQMCPNSRHLSYFVVVPCP